MSTLKQEGGQAQPPQKSSSIISRRIQIVLSILVLFINYFLSQYDKFILSYFQTPLSDSLQLTPAAYGVLSGYSTGIVYALAAIPIAYLADQLPFARVWVLAACSIWWSICVILQSLCNNFYQILLARIAMGLGQSCVEPLSVSLISDLCGGWRNVFIGESVFYVGVYIGEAISGQIATAFTDNQEGWRIALRAIGITGVVVGVVLRLIVRDQGRNAGVLIDDKIYEEYTSSGVSSYQRAKEELLLTIRYLVRMRSWWLLLLSSSIRQLAGNVFGYYMPSYLSSLYPDHDELLSRYGIIVGTTGSVAVLSGGVLTSVLWKRTITTPLWITGVGGMISSLFVLLMIFSKQIGGDNGISVLHGSMSAAYLTAELWLGAIYGLVSKLKGAILHLRSHVVITFENANVSARGLQIASILPPRYKTFGLAIWSCIQVLVYSSGPEIVGLALRTTDSGSAEYRMDTQIILAVIIPTCYWAAGVGFLSAIPLLRKDFKDGVPLSDAISSRRRALIWISMAMLLALVIALFIASIVYATID